jgi:hypothetical protein
MRRALIDPPGEEPVPEVVRTLCGVQAQVPSSAELAIALRRGDGRIGDASQALNERRLLRTWAMRGTLHLLEPDDAGSYLALMASIRSWERPAWAKSFGVSPAEMESLARIVEEVLDDRVLERSELVEEIAARTGSRDLDEHLRSGWGAVLKPLAWQGHLCNGPSAGNRVTFTKPQTWLPDWKGLPEVTDAARTVIQRYLTVFGPASPKSFAAWLARGGARSRDVAGWWEAASDLLAAVEVEGERLFALASDLDELAASRPSESVRLLAGFDQYVLGPGTSDARVVPPANRAKVSRAAGWIAPTVLVGGRVAGVWEMKGGRVVVEPFGSLGPSTQRQLHQEVERLACVTGEKLALDIS